MSEAKKNIAAKPMFIFAVLTVLCMAGLTFYLFKNSDKYREQATAGLARDFEVYRQSLPTEDLIFTTSLNEIAQVEGQSLRLVLNFYVDLTVDQDLSFFLSDQTLVVTVPALEVDLAEFPKNTKQSLIVAAKAQLEELFGGEIKTTLRGEVREFLLGWLKSKNPNESKEPQVEVKFVGE